MKERKKDGRIIGKILMMILVVGMMMTVLISVVACGPKGPFRGDIKVFNANGELVEDGKAVIVKYTGEQFMFSADYYIEETGLYLEKADEIYIHIYTYEEGKRIELDQGKQVNSDDFKWPKEVGKYNIEMEYDPEGNVEDLEQIISLWIEE